MFKQMAVLYHTALTIQSIVKLRVQDMEQIIIYIVCSQILKLLCKGLLSV